MPKRFDLHAITGPGVEASVNGVLAGLKNHDNVQISISGPEASGVRHFTIIYDERV